MAKNSVWHIKGTLKIFCWMKRSFMIIYCVIFGPCYFPFGQIVMTNSNSLIIIIMIVVNTSVMFAVCQTYRKTHLIHQCFEIVTNVSSGVYLSSEPMLGFRETRCKWKKAWQAVPFINAYYQRASRAETCSQMLNGQMHDRWMDAWMNKPYHVSRPKW